MHLRTLTALSLLVLSTGCTSNQTFHVSVKNDTDGAITVGLVKEGDPYQRQWAAPEQSAINGQQPSAEMWAAVAPGKTIDTGEVKGRFRSSAHAVLRVYKGELDLDGILAVSRGQPNRSDVLLHPGRNRIVVFDRGGYLIAVNDEPQAKSPVDR